LNLNSGWMPASLVVIGALLVVVVWAVLRARRRH
jgi:hypothetical protein